MFLSIYLLFYTYHTFGISYLQTGHVLCVWNHGLMQSMWNRCLHGSLWRRSSSANLSKHTWQSEISRRSCPRITRSLSTNSFVAGMPSVACADAINWSKLCYRILLRFWFPALAPPPRPSTLPNKPPKIDDNWLSLLPIPASIWIFICWPMFYASPTIFVKKLF